MSPREEINGRLLGALLEYASNRLGITEARKLLAQAAGAHGAELETVIDPRGWTSLEMFHAIADAYRPLLGDAVVHDAVRWAIPARRELSASSLTALTTPRFFYKRIDRGRRFFARHLRFHVDELRGSSAVTRLTYRDGVPRRRDSCDVARAVLTGVPLLFDLPAAELEETACFADGADACVFRVRWREERPLAALGLAAGGLAAIAGAVVLPHLAWLALPAAAWVLGRETSFRRRRRLMARVTEEHRRVLEDNERAFERRFLEIRRLNEQLEKRVGERTAQIHAAMEELRERNASMRKTLEEMDGVHNGLVDAGVRGLLGQTVQELAQEMRNPMTYVAANLEFLESVTAPEAEGPEVPLAELAETVRDARLGVDRMRGVLGWFLEIYQGDRAAPAPFLMDQELPRTLEMVDRALRGRIEVHLDLGQVPPVMGQGKQLNLVLLNLITNAAQAMQSGNLWLRTRHEGGSVVISVRDDGPGIDEALMPHLFERAMRPGTGAMRPGTGAGLGLYLAKAVVERHGGRIYVKSTKGQGAEFVVELPSARVTGR